MMSAPKQQEVGRNIGNRHPLELPNEGDGAVLVFLPPIPDEPMAAFFEIVVLLSDPNDQEIEALLNGPVDIGIGSWETVGVLFTAFGNDLRFDMPFDAGIERRENVAIYDESDGVTGRVPFYITGVNRADQTVFAFRFITASPKVSKHFIHLVRAMLIDPIDDATHHTNVAKMFAAFPKVGSLEKIAFAYELAGA